MLQESGINDELWFQLFLINIRENNQTKKNVLLTHVFLQ